MKRVLTPAIRLQLALFTVLAALLPAAGALASGTDVIRDCTDDEVMSKTYTQKEYRAALSELSADADQYGNCRDVILRAQQAALAAGKTKDSSSGANAGGGSASGGGSTGGTGGCDSSDPTLIIEPC